MIKSAETKTTYDFRLRQYMDYRRFNSVKDLLSGDPSTIQKDIIDYLKYLKNERQLSYATRQVVVLYINS